MVVAASFLLKRTTTLRPFSVRGKSGMHPSYNPHNHFARTPSDHTRTVVSPPVARRLLSGLKARPLTAPGWPDSVKNIPPSNVTGYQCKAFYDAAKKRVAASTAESYMFTLRSFFNWCLTENLCRRNPVIGVQLDRIDRKGRTRFADFDLAQRLIENAPNDDLRYILFCGFHTGMRKLEIIEAVPEWFNLSRRTVEIRATATFRPKDRDARTVPLTDQFAEFLKGYDLRSPYVLQPDVVQGSHRYRFDFRRAFSDYMNAEGVPWITPHVMRHSFASICASKGIDIYRIATWLGDDVRVVQRHYAKLRPDDREIMKAFGV